MDVPTSIAEDERQACDEALASGDGRQGVWLTRQEACELFGVKLRTWTEWERVGKVPPGGWGTSPKGTRCRVYSLEEMRRLKTQWERATEPYPDPARPGVVRVPVRSDKHPGMEALIDEADLPLIAGKRWNWSPGHQPGSGSVILAMTGTPKPSLARLLLGLDDPEQLVSHLNGDRLDCRRENLVVRTRSQVKRASKKVMIKGGKASTSRFKGVSRTESGRKWTAMMGVGGKSRYLGVFRSEVDAALAYDAAIRELTGDDPTGLNFPDPAEAERLRALEPPVEDDPTWPPPGMVDRHGACAMFGVALKTWTTWEQRGRITCGQYHPNPNDRGGRCKLYPKDELELARVEIEKLGKPYPDPDRPGVWRVPLKSYLAYREVLIDEADLPVVEGRNWNWAPRTDGDGGRVDGVVLLATTGKNVPLHRLIVGATDPAVRVAFLNGDALDCRRANLAARSLAETVQSTRKRAATAGRPCGSAFKGVSRDADRGLWVVQIRKGRVGISLGRFETEVDAAAAYDAAARVLFGPHAHLNLPDRPSTESAMNAARAAMAGATDRTRADRRRQRDLERALRAACLAATAVTDAASAGATIPVDTARQLFDVTPTVWHRWQRFGWLPRATTVTTGDGGEAYALEDVERLLAQCGIVALPYPDPQRAGCYRVPLSGERAGGREALIDADAVPLVRARRWRFAESDVGRGGNVETMNPYEKIRLHYVVMGLTADARNQHVGHRNDDPLDCRRANLVVRTLTDTASNKRKQATFCGRPCTSRFKGVYWDRRRAHWVACIKKDRIKRTIGTFRDEIAAAQAYDEAARELFGEHARPNFPKGVDARLAAEADAISRDGNDLAGIGSGDAAADRARAA